MRAALMIPALNEAAVIGATLERVPAGMYSTVLVVDNGSSDGTAELAAASGAQVVREATRGYRIACLRALATLLNRPRSWCSCRPICPKIPVKPRV